jgi:hypothetical protein
MIVSRMPSGPDEVRRFIAATEARPEAPHDWARVAEHCARDPQARAWFEEVVREIFMERVARGSGRVAVLCNIARRCGLASLVPLFASQLDQALDDWSDADLRSLLGAVLELGDQTSFEHISIDRIKHHGRRPDVFAVAIHLLAAVDAMEAAVFLRRQAARAARDTTRPERVWDSLARLYMQSPQGHVFARALAGLDDGHRQAFLDAVRARAAGDAIAIIGAIEQHWRDDVDDAARAPDPRSAELVRAFIDACQRGDVDATRALLVHPDDVRDLGASAVAYAGAVQAGLEAYMQDLEGWQSVVRVDAPAGPIEPGFAGANLFPYQIELAGESQASRVLSLVVLEYGDTRKIALPVAR